MEKNRTLHLTLKKKWFDMISSGEKREEYREIKDYWTNRLLLATDLPKISMKTPSGEIMNDGMKAADKDRFYFVKFINGYSKNSPSNEFYCEGITIGYGRPEWGAPVNELVYIIKIGEILPF